MRGHQGAQEPLPAHARPHAQEGQGGGDAAALALARARQQLGVYERVLGTAGMEGGVREEELAARMTLLQASAEELRLLKVLCV